MGSGGGQFFLVKNVIRNICKCYTFVYGISNHCRAGSIFHLTLLLLKYNIIGILYSILGFKLTK